MPADTEHKHSLSSLNGTESETTPPPVVKERLQEAKLNLDIGMKVTLSCKYIGLPQMCIVFMYSKLEQSSSMGAVYNCHDLV